MKYLITESKLEKVIFRYLNNQDFIQIDGGETIYFANSKNDEYAQIRYDKFGWCTISKKLVEEISNFFSLDEVDSKLLIGRWVEDTLQMKVIDIMYLWDSKSPTLRILRGVVFKYLDLQNFVQIDKGRNIYFVNSEGDRYAQIRYDKNTKLCHIDMKLINNISSFFFTGNWRPAEEAVKRWVEDILQMNITNVIPSDTSNDFRVRVND